VCQHAAEQLAAGESYAGTGDHTNPGPGKSKKRHLAFYGRGHQKRVPTGGQMSDEEALRRLAREAIRTQRIPVERPTGSWGGNGTGVRCDICGLPIADPEIELEVEFSQEGARVRSYYLHSRCFAAWELERHTVEAGEQHKGSHGGTLSSSFPHRACPPVANSQPATDSGLSAEDKAGSIPDRERDTKGGGESG
jgi:hypothetical protein